MLQLGARLEGRVVYSTLTLIVGLVARRPCTLIPQTLLGRPFRTMILAVMKKVISLLVVRGTLRVETSYSAIIR